MSPSAVRELYAVMYKKQVSIGFIFTTARITPKTENEAKLLGIRVIWGDDLADMYTKANEQYHNMK